MRTRRGIASILLLVVIALTAVLATHELEATYKPARGKAQDELSAAGAAIGRQVAGEPGAVIGQNLGYLIALLLGGVAAHRHAAACTANARLSAFAPHQFHTAPRRSTVLHAPSEGASP